MFAVLLALAVPLPQSFSDFEPSPGFERFRHGFPPELTREALDAGREVDADGYPLDLFVAGELVLVLAPGAEHAAAAVHAGIGARVVERMPARHAELVELPQAWSVARAIRAYERLPFVLHASRNTLHRLADVPHDAIYNDPIAGQWAYKRINCERAWDITKGASWTKIAVIDSGVSNHDDLGGSILPGRNVLDDSNNVTDNLPHGTDVAVIAAANHNPLGTAGVAPEALILPVKVTDTWTVDGWDVADGIWWAVDNDADIINLSLATPAYHGLIDWAVQDAWNANCVLVAGAGNDGTTSQQYPAANNNVIAVAATGYLTDARASISSHGSWVDVAAPGTLVAVSADETFQAQFVTGTSFAAPLVSGVAALVCADLGTGFDNDDVVARIKDNCDPVATGYTQKGRVNAREALSELNQSLHASWPAKALQPGSYTIVGGGLEQLSSTYGADLSLDTRSVASSKTTGGFTQHYQTVSVPLTFQVDVVTGLGSLNVRLEGRSSVANLPLTLEAWNNVTNTYQTLVTQNLVSTTADTTISFTIGDTAPLVTTDGTLYLRYRAVRSSFGTPVAPFTIEMDLARVKAVFGSQ
jgi:thermitase